MTGREPLDPGAGGRFAGTDPDHDAAASGAAARRPVVRVLWSAAGVLCVALGGVGIVVPGLPTTVFFILAAACFSRSSPRLEQWVLDLPRIGPMVRDHRAGLGMPRAAKCMAIGSILVFGGASAVLASSAVVRVAVVVAVVSGVAYLVRVVPTRAPDVGSS